MSILKWLLGVLLALVVLFVGIGLLLPASTHVERSITIAKPPAEVFAMLNSYERFNLWSPWFERDPQAAYTYEGPASGVGASMRWVSEKRDVGSGRQTITESVPSEKVAIKLEFEGQGDAKAAYLLTPEGGGTKVVWAFDTEHGYNPLSRWFGLMFDSMIGPDYEKGLAKLKTVMESEAP
jgi:carbon monoxide dehydrogenase subunit G